MALKDNPERIEELRRQRALASAQHYLRKLDQIELSLDECFTYRAGKFYTERAMEYLAIAEGHDPNSLRDNKIKSLAGKVSPSEMVPGTKEYQ